MRNRRAGPRKGPRREEARGGARRRSKQISSDESLVHEQSRARARSHMSAPARAGQATRTSFSGLQYRKPKTLRTHAHTSSARDGPRRSPSRFRGSRSRPRRERRRRTLARWRPSPRRAARSRARRRLADSPSRLARAAGSGSPAPRSRPTGACSSRAGSTAIVEVVRRASRSRASPPPAASARPRVLAPGPPAARARSPAPVGADRVPPTARRATARTARSSLRPRATPDPAHGRLPDPPPPPPAARSAPRAGPCALAG